MAMSNSFTDGFDQRPYPLIANTSARSLGSPSRASPGRTWTPAARMSIGSSAGPATSFASLMPHPYTSALPEWMPLFERGTDADSVLPCCVYAAFAPGRLATSVASSATVTSTVTFPPAGTVTGFDENETPAPNVDPTNAGARL